jgi:murein DD-endopeptidase MepM/ murein hydrolase activator NlpD
VIGYAGISGRSTGPHVHYEVRVNNAPVNPWRYMKNSQAAD